MLWQHVPDESVDLVYLDPPFNSNTSYNFLFGPMPMHRPWWRGRLAAW